MYQTHHLHHHHQIQQQQQVSYTEMSYTTTTSNYSIPSSSISFPPPLNSTIPNPQFSYDPSSFSYYPPPPGVASYPDSISNVTAFETQTQQQQQQQQLQVSYYQDPSSTTAIPSDSSSWVVKEAAPIKYPHPIQPIATTSYDASLSIAVPSYNAPLAFASRSYDASLTTNKVQKLMVRNASKKILKQSKGIPKKTHAGQINAGQNVRCELCKVDCNNIEMYEKHLSGKKHTKKLQNLYAPKTTSSTGGASQTMNNGTSSGGNSTPGGQGIPKAPSMPADLEAKKQKLLQGGAAVQSLRVCTICNVACNGEAVYADHLAGKKHIAQEQALRAKENPNLTSVSNPKPKSQSKKKKVTESKNGISAWCDVCKISCTSIDGLMTHRKGKKHQKCLEKLQNSLKDTNAPASTTAPPPSTNQPQANAVSENAEAAQTTVAESRKVKKKGARSKSPGDVETKKRKVLECGAAAEAVRTCTICNVVCNSDTVFKSHLAGQKHASMVKQAGAGTAPTNNQQLVSPTT